MNTTRPEHTDSGESASMSKTVESLCNAIERVFATMVHRPLTPLARYEGTPRVPGSVVGTVGFTGSSNGLVTVGCSTAAAREITAGLLDLTAAEIGDDIVDAIGEVANMVAGSFRTAMAAGTEGWAITMPVVTIGENFSIKYSSETYRVVCPYQMGPHDLYVELVVQPAGSVP
jgi:chemotaxis protein CheX